MGHAKNLGEPCMAHAENLYNIHCYIVTCTYKTSLLYSINNQYLTVLLCWCGGLPRPMAMVLLFYLKLLVQFQEFVKIIDIKCKLVKV